MEEDGYYFIIFYLVNFDHNYCMLQLVKVVLDLTPMKYLLYNLKVLRYEITILIPFYINWTEMGEYAPIILINV